MPCSNISPISAASDLSNSYPCYSYFSTNFNTFFVGLSPPPHVSYPCRVIPVLLTVGVIFSPKSPCGLKSNLSDFTYDGLKQVSVFKALKVMWEKWTACTERTPCVSPVPVLKCTIQSCDRDGYQTCKVNCGFWKNVHEDGWSHWLSEPLLCRPELLSYFPYFCMQKYNIGFRFF